MSERLARIPPHADLRFARNERTGTVHILPLTLEPWEDGDGPVFIITSGEQFAIAAGERTPMLCGVRLHMRPWGTEGDFIAEFRDDATCPGCVRALGDQSARAFEHPQGSALLGEESSRG